MDFFEAFACVCMFVGFCIDEVYVRVLEIYYIQTTFLQRLKIFKILLHLKYYYY